MKIKESIFNEKRILRDISLVDAIDMHMHAGPTIAAERVDFIDAAKDAYAEGMKAIVIKPMCFPTMHAAYAAEKVVPGIRVFGGIMLDYTSGGLDPFAVEKAIEAGAKYVWMPLHDTVHTNRPGRKPIYKIYKKRNYSKEKPEITIITNSGKLRPEVEEILDIIANAKEVVLGTSHCSPEESLVLIKRAKERGVRNIVVTHPAAQIIGATVEQQKEMAEMGAYLIHTCAQLFPTHMGPGEDPTKIAEVIKTVGAEHNCLATDLGLATGPPPTLGLKMFIVLMRLCGISQREIDIMVRENPAKILGI